MDYKGQLVALFVTLKEVSVKTNRLESIFERNQTSSFSVVIPAMNESENVLPLIERLFTICSDHQVEVLYIDDSRDTKTVEAVNEVSEKFGSGRFSVGIYHRTGDERWGGLSGAVTDGIRRALFDTVVVMDGDLQHPPELIEEMVDEASSYDLVVASRYCEGGRAEGLSGGIRKFVSRMSTLAAKVMFPSRLRNITDPMTGYFLVDRSQVDLNSLRPKGFKILLEILGTHPGLTRVEVPLEFAERNAGESNASLKQGIEFFNQLIMLKFHEVRQLYLSLPKFIQFAAVGGAVFGFGMVLLALMVELLGVPPLTANAIQIVVTFGLNYQFNRYVTWGERDLSISAVHKFLISRAATSVLNYILFIELFNRSFSFNALGKSGTIAIGYVVTNVITLIIITVLNYFISDLWTFAEARGQAVTQDDVGLHRELDISNAVHPVPDYVEAFYADASTETSNRVTLAKKVVSIGRRITVAGIVVAALLSITVGFAENPTATLGVVLATVGLFLFVQSTVEVWRMVYIYRHPEAVDNIAFPEPGSPQERFCLIVPARHESEVLGATLEQLARQTHPNVHIISVICDDDEETLKVAYKVAIANSRVTVMQYPLKIDEKPNKPKQLNHVYAHIQDQNYTVIGVIDAEDTVHPALLEHVDAAFARDKVDIVQGGVQLMNHDSTWYSLHNVLEYYRWFNSAMTFQATHKFMPLGGNTIFIKNDVLQKAGGWPDTLTEDCSLGVLLSSRLHAKTAVYYEPWLATREETPDSLKGLYKQRVRWNQGFFQEWLKGVWRELPTFRQRILASYVLMGPMILGGISVLMIISLSAALFLNAPVGLVLLMYLSLIPGILLVVLNAVFLHDFGKAFERKITLKHYAIVLFTSVIYQIVLNAAAFWAIVRHFRGEQSWHKTSHSGLHRNESIISAVFEGAGE